jgi:hypothetical protein
LSQSCKSSNNKSNKSSNPTFGVTSSTSISDTDDEASSSSTTTPTLPTGQVVNPTMKNDCSSSSSVIDNDSNTPKINSNGQIETPFIHGFAECIRLVRSSMKMLHSNQVPTALEDKLKRHLSDLHSMSMNKSPEIRHNHNHHHHECSSRQEGVRSPMTMMMDDHEDHEMMTLKGPSSPASSRASSITPHSQMSPVESIVCNMSSKAFINHSSSSNSSSIGHCESPKGINGAVLIPTRMSNGEIAFVLKCSDSGILLGTNTTSSREGGPNGYFDIDTPFHHKSHYGRMIRGEKTFPGYIDNHLDIGNDNQRVPWRPW